MIGNVLKPDGTVHIEQQVGNMRYDLTTGQVDTVVPGAGATNLVFGADGRPHVELTTGSIRQGLGRPGFDTLLQVPQSRIRIHAHIRSCACAHSHNGTHARRHIYAHAHSRTRAHRAPAPVGALFFQSFSVPVFKPLHTGNNHLRGNGQRRGRARTGIFRKEWRTEMRIPARALKPLAAVDSIKMYGSGNAQKLVKETTSIVDQVASGLKDSTGIDLPSLLNGLISNPDIDADSAENSVE